MNEKIHLAFSILLVAGCAAPDPNEGASDNFSYISASLKEHIDYTLSPLLNLANSIANR